MEKGYELKENINIPVEISFSLEDEILRVRNTIDKYNWFIENGYKIDLPLEIKRKLENHESIDNECIRTEIKEEYQDDKYQTVADEISRSLELESEDFFIKLKSLGRNLPEKYYITLTAYGTGGSYGFPDNIQLNINKINRNKGILYIVFHEMVHLAIEDLIKLHNISHWTKERLVNLTMNKFFPDKTSLQRSPENAEKILEIFEREFPNIEKIIEEVSKI